MATYLRNVKNVIHNYSDTQRKVREATSNDPWGPNSTIMMELSERSYNVIDLTEIMQIIWQRLNDGGKKWRHVYKSLKLVDFMVKNGSEKIATFCREDIHLIETLKEFEYIENNVDHGFNVRAKAKALSDLLRNEEQLQDERAKASRTRERLMQAGIGGSKVRSTSSSNKHMYTEATPMRAVQPAAATELDSVRPQSIGEEQLQLQLALAISKEEHDLEERRRKSDEAREDAKVQMALEQSRGEELDLFGQRPQPSGGFPTASRTANDPFDFMDQPAATSVPAAKVSSDPWGVPNATPVTLQTGQMMSSPSSFPQSAPVERDPWTNFGATEIQNPSLTIPVAQSNPNTGWPLQPSEPSRSNVLDIFDSATVDPSASAADSHSIASDGLFNNVRSPLTPSGVLTPTSTGVLPTTATTICSVQEPDCHGEQQQGQEDKKKKTAADFLGEHRKLVDLDRLIDVHPEVRNEAPNNIFGKPNSTPTVPPTNPFMTTKPAPPALNEIGSSSLTSAGGPWHSTSYPTMPQPSTFAVPMIQQPYGNYQANPNLMHPSTTWGASASATNGSMTTRSQPGLNPFL